MDTKVSDFKSIKLKLASPEEILSWSRGEVTKPETINYRTQRAEKDGLFCERIFGPEKDWECYCGKYRRIRYKGIVCDKCGVEVTKSSVRRERMGHIALVAPVSHIWFLKGLPSKMGLILDRSAQDLEKVIYFAGYIITKINEEERKQVISDIKKEYKAKLKDINPSAGEGGKQNLKEQQNAAVREVRGLYKHQILTEIDYRNLSLKYGQIFEAGTGSETLRAIFEKINLEALAQQLKDQKKNSATAAKIKLLKRLRLIEGMIRAKIRPEWMFLTILPVLPPDLRPMVQLDGGRYATSDVNDLYRRVINRNNRLKRLLDLKAPEVICRNEKRMLQEAVDALIDNTSRRGQVTVAASTGQKRVLKSLADMLKGKQGRFRQNLLGKRVDYSGRSVIVVGPTLKIDQCGLPKHMALELFKPFVINKLVERELAHNVRGAGRLIEEEIDEVWDILEEVTKGRCVLLNRAPTLHRLGIQAFYPILIEGKAIQLHPLVCRAFNADFDGDQMAVHLPLGKEAQKEAKEKMIASKNILKPSTGEPVAVPSLDMVLGCYWMTKIKDGLPGEGKIFSNTKEAILAKHFEAVHLRAKVKVRLEDGNLVETSVGRIIFNEPLPKEMGFINKGMGKKELRKLAAELVEKFGIQKTALVLDKIKRMGFKYASVSGISWGMNDLRVPKEKIEEIKKAERELKTVQNQYDEGLLTDDERKARVIEIWMSVSDKIAKKAMNVLDPDGSIFDIFDSGARGSLTSLTQMTGMKGLVVNPSNEIIELPIKNSYKEGLNVLEYFISTHGGRKGLADTALKTAQAGYLTRRLVDVCQDVVIREEDCGDKTGICIYREDEEDLGSSFARRVVGRVALDNIYLDKSAKKKLLVKSGVLINKEAADKIDKAGISKIRVRSVISCKSLSGVCQKCYGYDLGRNKLIELGEAVGIVTAQAIGEPATQLTLRTFHTGGVAGGQDITQGLPRVEEIFEVRVPKGKTVISEVDGRVKNIIKQGTQKIIQIEPIEETKLSAGKKSVKDGKKPAKGKGEGKIIEYTLPAQIGLRVESGDLVGKGQQLGEGHIDLKDLYKTAGQEAVQRYILKEVQRIYTFAGENIDDKHIEMIIRQMFSRYKIQNPGSTNLLAGEIVEQSRFLTENQEVKKKNGQLASGQPILLGVTKTSLTTESFLSAASFIQTTQVLINASIQGKEDKLKGLKENVIIGKLIPAGTGFRK
ncbi:MAG: DNA-directed RNA polymerase subunit beta' [Patescibacteria group bacterium]|nr:DNA-directed RNA polymerase subunit beta' [Patescibacteria group bacterium]